MTSSVLGIDTQTGQRIELLKSSRLQGLYIIGAPGQGKTGLIENLIMQDIQQGLGICLLDPHGDLTQAILSKMPGSREQDVIYLDIANEDYPFGLNLFACTNPKSGKAVQYVVDQVMHIFERLFDVDRATPLLSEYLRNCTHTLVVNPGYTMADIPLLLLNDKCRKKLVSQVTDPDVLLFWQAYEQMKPSEQREEASSTLRRVREFLQPLSRNIVGQSTSTIDLRFVMDERKILLVKLDARLPSVTSLIGSVIVAQLLNAAYSRTDLEIKRRKQFNIYADEFQRFTTKDFALLLSEARKFGIGTTIAHQFRDQLDDENKGATLTAANLVVFRISGVDAEELAKQFDHTPTEYEVGETAVKAPTTDPIGHLLTNGHPNEGILPFIDLVRRFKQAVQAINQYTPLLVLPEEIKRQIHQTWGSYDSSQVHPNQQRVLVSIAEKKEREALAKLNEERRSKFYERKHTLTFALDDLTSLLHKAMSEKNCPLIPQDMFITLLGFFCSFLTFYMPTEDYWKIHKPKYSYHDGEPVSKTYWNVLHHNFLNGIHNLLFLPYLEEQSQEKYAKTCKFIVDTWTEALVSLEYEKKFQALTQQYKKNIEALIKQLDVWKEEQRKTFKPIAIGHFNEALSLVRTIFTAVEILRAEPILVPTGQYTPKYTPRTYADMGNEIASSLANLPKYAARVKIVGADDKPIEYTIKTLVSERGSGKVALQAAIERIQINNRTDGYTRKSEDVEDEIRRRQDQCSQSSQQEIQLEPQSRRGLVCQKCSVVNQPDAKFCKQCGNQL